MPKYDNKQIWHYQGEIADSGELSILLDDVKDILYL
jgi:hypothetical protein